MNRELLNNANTDGGKIADARRWAWERAADFYSGAPATAQTEALAVRLADFVMTGTFAAS